MSTGDIRARNDVSQGDAQLLEPGERLIIPATPATGTAAELVLPNSEIVFSPGVLGFDTAKYVAALGGYLSVYRQRIDGQWLSGAEVVDRVAQEHSLNPRLLLAVLEYRSGWLTNPEIPTGQRKDFAVWVGDGRLQGLYLQLTWAANQLSEAYYGWRVGAFPELKFANGSRLALAPELNAGTVALQHLLSQFQYRPINQAPPATDRFMRTYTQLFGEPWAYRVPLFEAGISQPEMSLPFTSQHPWLFTGGPHGAWSTESGWAAVDFAPKWDRERRTSDNEVIAVSRGRVSRLDPGVLVLDLDGDGFEQTGWVVVYLHVIPAEGIVEGMWVAQGQPVGYAAEVGGVSNGLHLHLARKHNGEWILADGPLPMDLGGWRVRAGEEPYQGVLFREGCELLACPCASQNLLSVGGGVSLAFNLQPANLIGCCPNPTQPTATIRMDVIPSSPQPALIGHGPF